MCSINRILSKDFVLRKSKNKGVLIRLDKHKEKAKLITEGIDGSRDIEHGNLRVDTFFKLVGEYKSKIYKEDDMYIYYKILK